MAATMRSDRELTGAFVVLLAIQTLTSFGAITLLGRMSPAIEHIIEENVASIEAVETMFAVLSLGPEEAASPAARSDFRAALADARAALAHPDERAPLAAIERDAEAALSGDAAARERVRRALRALGGVNRRAMEEADARAKRLTIAGAWAAVLLGFTGFAAGVLAWRRTRRHLLYPVAELYDVLHAYRTGETHRRATPGRFAGELDEIMRGVNDLLDRVGRAEVPAPPADRDRLVLLRVLDSRPEPIVVIESDGALSVANKSALVLLEGDRGLALREALRRVPEGQRGDGVGAVTPLAEHGGYLCVLDAASDGRAASGAGAGAGE